LTARQPSPKLSEVYCQKFCLKDKFMLLAKRMTLSAVAALGLAAVPGCAANTTGSDQIKFTLSSGKEVPAVRWSRFIVEHPAEVAAGARTALPVEGGTLRFYPKSSTYVFLTSEEAPSPSEVSYCHPDDASICAEMCCNDLAAGFSDCELRTEEVSCYCSSDGCSIGRPFAIDGVARVAPVELNDGWIAG
jgi:hypothetical protein